MRLFSAKHPHNWSTLKFSGKIFIQKLNIVEIFNIISILLIVLFPLYFRFFFQKKKIETKKLKILEIYIIYDLLLLSLSLSFSPFFWLPSWHLGGAVEKKEVKWRAQSENVGKFIPLLLLTTSIFFPFAYFSFCRLFFSLLHLNMMLRYIVIFRNVLRKYSRILVSFFCISPWGAILNSIKLGFYSLANDEKWRKLFIKKNSSF